MTGLTADAMDDIGVPRHLVHELRDLTHKWDAKKAELANFVEARAKRYREYVAFVLQVLDGPCFVGVVLRNKLDSSN